MIRDREPRMHRLLDVAALILPCGEPVVGLSRDEHKRFAARSMAWHNASHRISADRLIVELIVGVCAGEWWEH